MWHVVFNLDVFLHDSFEMQCKQTYREELEIQSTAVLALKKVCLLVRLCNLL